MANTLTITTNLVDSTWVISGSLSAGTLPTEVFMYGNTGTSSIGTYVGVCSLGELARLQVFSGVALPIFGNKFVRSASLNIVVPLSTDPALIVTNIVSSIQSLSKAYKAKINITQVFPIL